MEDLSPGDEVQLKSGGPAMTMEKIEGEKCWVRWFEKGELKTALFYLTSLKKVIRNPRER